MIRLSIGHKIIGVALVVLVLMLIAAVYSIHLTARISSDLDSISRSQIPMSQSVARMNARMLEQGILLQRLLLLPEESREFRATRTAFEEHDGAVEKEFATARSLLAESTDSRHAIAATLSMVAHLGEIERGYEVLREQGLLLLRAHGAVGRDLFDELLEEFSVHQDAIDEDIAAFRRESSALAEQAVVRAD